MLISEPLQPIDFIEHHFETRNRISEKDTQEILIKYKKGLSLKEISTLLGRSKSKIRKELIKQGIMLRTNKAQATSLRPLKSGKQGALPYFGFCYFQGKIIKDPREYPTLEFIFKCWKQGLTIHQINKELNQKNFLSRTNKNWCWAAIKKVITRFENQTIICTKGGSLELRKNNAICD